ncbi:hypothetical protein LWI28_010827 [Acer negundo]|uniref:Uncharacterized protein n=1 Tax=Acer negundo TaxID=4023 RepID=A0AAD5P0G1_ACENE|nr:hypothetical protein LWI28_010827 [Acer negundo]
MPFRPKRNLFGAAVEVPRLDQPQQSRPRHPDGIKGFVWLGHKAYEVSKEVQRFPPKFQTSSVRNWGLRRPKGPKRAQVEAEDSESEAEGSKLEDGHVEVLKRMPM